MSRAPSSPMRLLLRWRARLIPDALGLGWMPFFGLGYLAFLFMPIVLVWVGDARGGWIGPIESVLWPTLLSIAAFLPLYFLAYRRDGVARVLCVSGIVAIGCALLPVNPFANAYTIYAVGFAANTGRSLRSGLAWASAALLALLIETVVLDYPPFVFLITLLVAVGVFFGNHQFMQTTRKRAELKLSHDEVRRLATLAERERIGRDLHDLLGHTLSLVALKSDLAGKLLQRGDSAEARAAAQREIAEVSRVAREALAQVRAAVAGIRAAGLAAELASAKLLLESDGIAFASVYDPDWLEGGELRAEVETALAMTVREAVTNIQRHARAGAAQVALETVDGEAVLRIIDDGRGGAIVPGNGLAGMRERIESVGGRLRVDSRRGEGTRVEARVPLVAADGGEALA